MLQIIAIPAFDDNYIWLLHNPEVGSQVAVVDPGDEDPVIETLQRLGLQLKAILITHKHGDHVGGVTELSKQFGNLEVYGPANEPIRGITRELKEGDHVALPFLGAEFTVMEVPGHTEGHLAYYGEGALFCGDTLFAGGCGRVFSGTHTQLYHSLSRIAALPENTQVYCAHEYTLANLGFAKWVEPDNPDVIRRLQEVEQMRREGTSTVPCPLEIELKTNPFMRTGLPQVIAAAERQSGQQLTNGAAVFTAVREWKDREYD